MGVSKIKSGKIKVEIRVLNPERVLNAFWNRGIEVSKVKKKNITTLILDIDYVNYSRVCETVESLGGKIKVLGGSGFIFMLGKAKKRLSLVIGAVMFFCILYYLSTYIWAVEINVQENIAPFEVRQELMSMGIKPGISKKGIKVKEVEKQLENMNSEILWLRVRIEGSTLKVNIEEKVNPPTQWTGDYGNLVATKSGEVQRVYTYSGKSTVKPGDNVKAGDILIKGIDGREGEEYIVKPRGTVIANTFHEKEMEVTLDGTKLERSGKVDSEYYLNIFGMKLYLKKTMKDFTHYDRIEKSGKIFNEVLYYERVDKSVKLTEEEGINLAVTQLEESLKQELTRDAKVVDKIVTKQLDSQGNMRVKVVFVVEENILNDIPINY